MSYDDNNNPKIKLSSLFLCTVLVKVRYRLLSDFAWLTKLLDRHIFIVFDILENT
jgi:hypothetical protein